MEYQPHLRDFSFLMARTRAGNNKLVCHVSGYTNIEFGKTPNKSIQRPFLGVITQVFTSAPIYLKNNRERRGITLHFPIVLGSSKY